MKKWKKWESQTNSLEYQFAIGSELRISLTISFQNLYDNVLKEEEQISWKIWSIHADPSRFRFTHQTSFVKRHLGSFSSTPGLRWIVSYQSPNTCLFFILATGLAVPIQSIFFEKKKFMPCLLLGSILQAVLWVRHQGGLPDHAARLHQCIY